MTKKTSFSLSQCKKNTSYIVQEIIAQTLPISRRLLELGFVSGAEVKIVETSALKKTLLVEIDQYLLSLRLDIASAIFVAEKI